MAQEQPQLRTDWRPPTETVFFDCSRAIYLPPRLPDGTTATNVIRRVYLDGKALVRFELAVFGNAKHHYPDSKGRLDEFARFFWKARSHCPKGRYGGNDMGSSAVAKNGGLGQ